MITIETTTTEEAQLRAARNKAELERIEVQARSHPDVEKVDVVSGLGDIDLWLKKKDKSLCYMVRIVPTDSGELKLVGFPGEVDGKYPEYFGVSTLDADDPQKNWQLVNRAIGALSEDDGASAAMDLHDHFGEILPVEFILDEYLRSGR